MSSNSTQDSTWKLKEQGDETQYALRKDQERLAALRTKMESDAKEAASRIDKDYESGYGGQEDLEDRYATTSGEH